MGNLVDNTCNQALGNKEIPFCKKLPMFMDFYWYGPQRSFHFLVAISLKKCKASIIQLVSTFHFYRTVTEINAQWWLPALDASQPGKKRWMRLLQGSKLRGIFPALQISSCTIWRSALTSDPTEGTLAVCPGSLVVTDAKIGSLPIEPPRWLSVVPTILPEDESVNHSSGRSLPNHAIFTAFAIRCFIMLLLMMQ